MGCLCVRPSLCTKKLWKNRILVPNHRKYIIMPSKNFIQCLFAFAILERDKFRLMAWFICEEE